jgi:seryl-tRNA synthetase
MPVDLVDEFVKTLVHVFPGTEHCCLNADRTVVDLWLAGPQDSARSAEVIAEIADKLSAQHRPAHVRTIARRERRPSFTDDPHAHLERTGDLCRLGRGRVAFGPRMVALISALDACLREFASSLDASSAAFPSLIGADVLDRCRYFHHFPGTLTLASHLHEDYRNLQAFADLARWDGAQMYVPPHALAPFREVLAPSVCFHWYGSLQNSTLPETRTVTALGRCFRYESGNLSGLERLWDFSMREVIVAGTAERVHQQRDRFIGGCEALLDQLELAF